MCVGQFRVFTLTRLAGTFMAMQSMLLFESLGVVWVLSYPASHPNHTSYRKFYFNEFVANVLHDNMGMIIFDLRGCGGCQRPKTSYLGAHFGNLTQRSVHPSAPVLLTKDSPRSFITYDSQPPFSLHISNSRTIVLQISIKTAMQQ